MPVDLTVRLLLQGCIRPATGSSVLFTKHYPYVARLTIVGDDHDHACWQCLTCGKTLRLTEADTVPAPDMYRSAANYYALLERIHG